MPKVSVVMSCYNEEPTLDRAIDSILNQSFRDIEFIILDDGSTDRTIEIIQNFQEKDNRIRLIKNDKNIGLAAALNKGIAAATGEYIARMDADDISLLDRLEKQIRFLDTHPEVDILGTNAILQGQSIGTSHTQLPLTHDLIYKNRYRKTIIIHPTVVIRAKCFEQSGYDPDLRWAEDKDLWLRWIDSYTFANLPDQLLIYQVKGRINKKILLLNHQVLWNNMTRRGELLSHFHEFMRSVISHLMKMI